MLLALWTVLHHANWMFCIRRSCEHISLVREGARLNRLFSALPAEALGMAIRGVVDLNERLTLDKMRNRSTVNTQGSGPPSPASGRVQVPYDPSVVFMLEFMMSIAGEAEHAIRETW